MRLVVQQSVPSSRSINNSQRNSSTIRKGKSGQDVGTMLFKMLVTPTDPRVVEEKLGSSRKRKRGQNEEDSPSDSDSSSSEDEDEVAALATEALDSEILATLNAIRSKDPRVYDGSSTFYSNPDDQVEMPKQKKDKPVYLKDYHRQNLLDGVKPDENEQPLSYNQEQENLKRSIVSEMHAAVNASDDDSDSEGGLFVRKSKKEPDTKRSVVKVDVEQADRDPETFLSNFMAARAWVPTDQAEFQPFESDDDSDEERAEKFEEAYNMRFEAPEKSNETLRAYSREYAEKYSVRREENNARQKKREAEKAAKAAAKQQLKEEKARLKKLKLEEVQEKVKRIKRAAGLRTSDLQPEDWARFIDDDWDDSKWEQEMQTRFGDQYYAVQEEMSDDNDDQDDEENADDNGADKKKKKNKIRKPKFDDDIDIKDIVPDFKDDEEAVNFSLSEEDEQQAISKPRKSQKQSKIDSKQESRRERRIISALIDDQMNLDFTAPTKSSGFRYRETSPQDFGLTSRDILLADDSALNSFAGLKKLAAFRDETKKAKDRKHLGKKARLRKWRLETFGNEEGPIIDEAVALNGDSERTRSRDVGSDEEMGGVDIREGGRKKKGRRRKKTKTEVTV